MWCVVLTTSYNEEYYNCNDDCKDGAPQASLKKANELMHNGGT